MLTKGNVKADVTKCRLCDNQSHAEFTMMFRQQYHVTFYKCVFCGLLQTENPFWLNEAYDKTISPLDTGILMRNLYFMKIIAVLLRFSRERHGVFLDYGGAHGIFTRLMRDHGYDFRCEDCYAENLYAAGFEYERGTPLSGVTAIEVLEHLENPKAFFKEIFGVLKPKVFLATTKTFAESVDPEWHYIYPASGQHIAFYQEKTLSFIAEQYGYSYLRYRDIHLFTIYPVSELLVKIMIRLSRVIYPFIKFNSLHAQDQQDVQGQL